MYEIMEVPANFKAKRRHVLASLSPSGGECGAELESVDRKRNPLLRPCDYQAAMFKA